MARTTEELLQELIELQKNNGNRSGDKMSLSSGPKVPTDDGGLQGFVRGVASGAKGVQKAVEEQAETWRAASNIGIGFNNDALGLRASIGETRLGVNDYTDVINRAKQGFTSLGGSMGESAKAFNKLSYDFANSDAVDRLTVMGYTLKESNEILALSVAGKRIDVKNDAEASSKARLAAEQLAGEMDKVAQLSGVSRKAQMTQLEDQQRDARLQATLEIELRRGGKDVADMYQKSSVQLQGMGLDKLGKELFTGQALSEKAQAQLNALGGAGTDLRNAMTAMRTARSTEEKATAQQMMTDAQAAVARRQNEDSYLELVRRGQGAVAEAAGESFIAAKNSREGIMAMQKELAAAGKPATEEAAKAALDERVRNAQKGLDANADRIAGANVTEAAIKAQNRLKDATVVFAQILESVNTRAGKTSEVAAFNEKFRNEKTDAKGNTTAASQRFGENSLQKVPGLIDSGQLAKGLSIVVKEGAKELAIEGLNFGKAAAKSIIENVPQIAKDFVTGAKDALKGITETPVPTRPTETRDTGTLGMTGGLFEPKDFFGKVQKGETVFTPDQLQNLVKGIASDAKIQMPQEFTTMFQTMQTNARLPQQDQSQLMGAIAKNIQSAMAVPKKEGEKSLDPTAVLEKVKTDMGTAAGQLKSSMSSLDPAALFQSAFKANNLFGNLDAVIPNNPITKTGEAAKEIPASTKKAEETKNAKKEEDNKKSTAAAQQATSTTTAPKSSGLASKTATLDDLKEQLIQLNKTMVDLVSHSADAASSAEKQVRATKRLDPNVAMR